VNDLAWLLFLIMIAWIRSHRCSNLQQKSIWPCSRLPEWIPRGGVSQPTCSATDLIQCKVKWAGARYCALPGRKHKGNLWDSALAGSILFSSWWTCGNLRVCRVSVLFTHSRLRRSPYFRCGGEAIRFAHVSPPHRKPFCAA